MIPVLNSCPYIFVYFHMLHSYVSAWSWAIVVLLIPEGFTSSKLPARPDVGVKHLCYVYEWFLLIRSTTVHCRVKGSCVHCLSPWQGEVLDFHCPSETIWRIKYSLFQCAGCNIQSNFIFQIYMLCRCRKQIIYTQSNLCLLARRSLKKCQVLMLLIISEVLKALAGSATGFSTAMM